MEMYVLAVIVIVVVTLYLTKWLSIEVTSLSIPPLLILTGILDTRDALSGFASSATVTIGALFIVSAGLRRTGALDLLGAVISRFSKGSATRLLIIMAVTVPCISAFMNNIPVVAMLLPVIVALSRDVGVKPSKLLIPLSYFAILGGTCTLIGTGTNIVVHEFYCRTQAEAGLAPTGFSMFEFAPMGLLLLASGVAFIFFVGRRILPDRASLTSMLPRQRTGKFVTEVLLEEGSSLIGQSVGETFSPTGKVRLLEIIRREEVIVSGAARGLRFESDDALIVEGAPADITEFLSRSQASLASVIEDDRRVPTRSMELMLGEAVVLPDSPFIGRTVGGLALNKHHGVKVMALQRGGQHHRKAIRETRLKVGDVLLLQADDQGFESLRESDAVLIVEGLEGVIKHKERRYVAIATIAAIVLFAALSPLPIVALAIAGATLMIATRCLRIDEAVRALDFQVLFLLSGTIPLGLAMSQTGLARVVVAGRDHGSSRGGLQLHRARLPR